MGIKVLRLGSQSYLAMYCRCWLFKSLKCKNALYPLRLFLCLSVTVVAVCDAACFNSAPGVHCDTVFNVI